MFYDLTKLSDDEIKGSLQLKAYLTICRDILTDNVEKFVASIFRAIDYLLALDDQAARKRYFNVLMTYIFNAGQKLTEKEVDQVVKKIPEGREVVMTLAELYMKRGMEQGMEKGLEEGKQLGLIEGEIKGIKKVTLNLIAKGYSLNEISEVTGLSKDEIKKINEKHH